MEQGLPVLCLSGEDAPLPYAQGLQEMSAPRSADVVGAVENIHNISMEPVSAAIPINN